MDTSGDWLDDDLPSPPTNPPEPAHAYLYSSSPEKSVTPPSTKPCTSKKSKKRRREQHNPQNIVKRVTRSTHTKALTNQEGYYVALDEEVSSLSSSE